MAKQKPERSAKSKRTEVTWESEDVTRRLVGEAEARVMKALAESEARINARLDELATALLEKIEEPENPEDTSSDDET